MKKEMKKKITKIKVDKNFYTYNNECQTKKIQGERCGKQ